MASASRVRGKTSRNQLIRHPDGHPIQNAILLNLPANEWDSVFSVLTFVELPTHIVLTQTGAPIESAHFVNSGLASVLSVMSNGKTVEVGLIGKEGFVGIPLIAGFSSSPNRIVMQVGGQAYRVATKDLMKILPRCPILEKRLQQHSQELTIQATQTAACNRLHGVGERLARWLLMSQDRLGGDIVPLTQQYLSHMLGTRRASVTDAAGILQKAGSIKYVRGDVTITNRRKLEKDACECYSALNHQSRKWQKETV